MAAISIRIAICVFVLLTFWTTIPAGDGKKILLLSNYCSKTIIYLKWCEGRCLLGGLLYLLVTEFTILMIRFYLILHYHTIFIN